MPLKEIELQKTYVISREDRTYVLNGNANIINENKENLTDIIEVQNIKENTTLEFPYFYYVGYKITIEREDETKEITPIESENGYLACKIEDNIDNATIKVEYVGTIIEKVSYIISFISLIVFIIYIIFEKKKEVNNDKN